MVLSFEVVSRCHRQHYRFSVLEKDLLQRLFQSVKERDDPMVDDSVYPVRVADPSFFNEVFSIRMVLVLVWRIFSILLLAFLYALSLLYAVDYNIIVVVMIEAICSC